MSYSGSAADILAAVLLGVALVLGALGIRLKRPIEPKRPGKYMAVTLVLIFLLAGFSFLVSVATYGAELIRQSGSFTPPSNPISPITFGSVFVTFCVVALLSWQSGWITALGSAAAATIAAPMIFELPFDLIVMGRTYPPAPALQFTLLFFLPLWIVGISAFALTTVSPLMKVTRYTLFCLAGMFLVFSAWALFDFSYPAAPIPIALNAISKVLSFMAAVTLFLPEKGKVFAEHGSGFTSPGD